MDKEKFKIIIPEVILNEIKQKGKLRANRAKEDFKPVDMLDPLYSFIKDVSEDGLKNLNLHYYGIFKDHAGLSSKTLGFAFSRVGEKDDGAMRPLCNLLCYLRYKKSWEAVLKDKKLEEDDIIQETEELKEKRKQEIRTEIYLDELKKRGKSSAIQDEKSDSEIKLFAVRLYIELISRKAGTPIQEDKDVIEEVYNSWYKLFCNIRDDMKTLSAHYLTKSENQNPVIALANKILNEILRPHLTEHQAKYRSWLEEAKHDPKNKGISPQDLQKKYPDYKILMKSIKQVNGMLVESAERLRELMK